MKETKTNDNQRKLTQTSKNEQHGPNQNKVKQFLFH